MNTTMLVVWIVWAALGLGLLALMLYRIGITKNEEDRLFLDGGNELQHHEQQEMLAKLERLRPMIRILGGAIGLVSLGIVGFYLMDALRQF